MTTPSVANYSLLKGKLHIAAYAASPSNWTAIGNCASVQVEHQIEKLPHYSSMVGLKKKDADFIISLGYTVTFETDEICAENLLLWCMGTNNGDNISALTATTNQYSLKFVEDKAIGGTNRTYVFHKVNLSPNGAGALVSEELGVLSFTAEGLADEVNHNSSMFYDIRWTSTTTSTTSTTTSST